MKVSVIIPNYNHSPYLRERIESVLDQTFQDFEVIILDDCSQDNSRQLIEQFRGHPKVSHLVFNEVNSGSTFKQWKAGIALARGEWIWIAESDDWCEPTLLATLLRGLSDDSTLAFCQSLVVDNKGEVMAITSGRCLEETLDGNQFIQEQMLTQNTIKNASMALFRKSCFHQVEDDFTTFRYCGDWLFWIEIARQGKVFISGKVLNYFRKHEKDVSGNAMKSGLSYFESFKLYDILQQRNIIGYAEKVALLKFKYGLFVNDNLLDQEARTALQKYFQSSLKSGTYTIRLRSRISAMVQIARNTYKKILK